MTAEPAKKLVRVYVQDDLGSWTQVCQPCHDRPTYTYGERVEELSPARLVNVSTALPRGEFPGYCMSCHRGQVHVESMVVVWNGKGQDS